MNASMNRAQMNRAATAIKLLRRVGQIALFSVALLVCAAPAVAANDEENLYLKIYSVVQKGDELSAAGKTAAAVAKYREAQSALATFQRDHRDWNPKLVSYRLSDLAAKLSAAADAGSAKAGAGVETKSGEGSSTTVRLIDAGGEPRKKLRLHPKAGDKQTLSLTLRTAVETKVGEAETPSMKMPPMKLDVAATVKEVAANGDISYDMVVEDATTLDEEGVLPAVVDAMRTALKAVKGMAGQYVSSDRGVARQGDVKTGATGDAQSRQAVDQMKDSFAWLMVPFPEEEVGPGARWEVKAKLKAQGIALDQTTVCELVSVEDEVLKIKSTISQQASNQKISNPAMPAMKMDLTKMTGKGSGEVVSDLSRLLILEGKADAQTDASMTMNMGGQQQAMTIITDVKVQISPP